MKIAFIDLEGTLVKRTSWDKIKDKFGAKNLSEEYNRFYSEGKVGYEEWRRKLVEIWRKNKITKQHFIDIWRDYELIPCTKELILGLKNKDFKIVIITGAPDVFTEIVAKDIGIDEVYCAHTFVFDKKGIFLDIKTHPEYGRGQGKVKIIREIIKKYKADEKDCITIGGDDINDYWMIKEFNSFAVNSPIKQIKEVAKHNVNKSVDILSYLR